MTLIGEFDVCDEHGETVIVDDHTESVQQRSGETEYRVINFRCGCEQSWRIRPRVVFSDEF